jgi:hypothetical protein
MTQIVSSKAKELETIMAELPDEKAQEVLDFAHYLRQRYVPQVERGSASAILETLGKVGALQFEEGELTSLLEDLAAMRQMDMNTRD